ncbi:putative DNA binding domain-containing protein [Rhodomicrobium sp. Az07]|uniref:ATP-binding protein n=1 Tax=Rhodomicrobium sp. Az07 TaxID=2839034 RepID=UPI001BE81BA8|nr:RNA-binding domain-containing protein [Rhodomicrobium sp. Az07]MBT3071434.1 putative DNA binding domain-containing protein [Rhodomicrobium sp. Az07]
MSRSRSSAQLTDLVRDLCALPAETEWAEFKHNNENPDEIGEYVSALANSAALVDKPFGYLLWGIEDGTHDIVGTGFQYRTAKKGGEALENWLSRLLTPRLNLRFCEISIDGKNVTLLEIPRAFGQPVQFQGQEYIRIGSQKKKLKEFPEKERMLWRIFEGTTFEDLHAASAIGADDVLQMLDYPAYFELLKRPLPEGKSGILETLESDALIIRAEGGSWNITNLGAILLAKRLADFPGLGRKAMRVVVYKGTNRVETLKEQVGAKGYASGFEGLIGFINGLLPTNEVIGKALRSVVPMFPALAVRELVANALIHQDFMVTGTGPMVEIFDDRMEISNPGVPLIAPERFLDIPPRSRNEKLAALMRRFGICEERGSGIDKVVFEIEFYQLPAALFEARGESTIAVLFAQRPLTKMDKLDRIRACYQHASLRYVSHDFMTNTSLRERFGIKEGNKAQASRFIKEALDARKILPYDEHAAPKLMKYIPHWARSSLVDR